MKKKIKSNSIILLSIMILLICLFMPLINNSNSWFTQKNTSTLQFDVVVSDLNASIEQVVDAETITLSNENYINFSGKIYPDVQNSLSVQVRNKDAGTAILYFRYKLELYAVSGNGDKKIPINVANIAPTGSKNGFNGVNVDGQEYFVYQNSSGTNVKLDSAVDEAGFVAQMFEGFTIPMSSFLDLALSGGETLKLVLTVESSLEDFV